MKKECSCPDVKKRYCKGCYADVTKSMFCYCGEFYLNVDSTYNENEIKKRKC